MAFAWLGVEPRSKIVRSKQVWMAISFLVISHTDKIKLVLKHSQSIKSDFRLRCVSIHTKTLQEYSGGQKIYL